MFINKYKKKWYMDPGLKYDLAVFKMYANMPLSYTN